MLSAIAAVIDSQDPDEIQQIVDTIPDPLGYVYRFGMSASSLRRVKLSEESQH